MNLENSYVEIELINKRMFKIPLKVIAEDRAKYYAQIDNVSFEESMNNDTIPLFKSDPSEVNSWLQNNMNLKDIKEHMILIPINDEKEEERLIEKNLYDVIRVDINLD